MDRNIKPLRVLSLDGGGMRGIYSANYLSRLTQNFARKNGSQSIDLGKQFDLIAGTSTGAFIACGLAAGIDLVKIVTMYQEFGNQIFQLQLPHGNKLTVLARIVKDIICREKSLEAGTSSLRQALLSCFGDETIGMLYDRRKIALAIPAIEMGRHRGWVFKTAHLENSSKRDDDYLLVDVCLASSAAPIYRSLAAIDVPNSKVTGAFNVFCDGGLWANNPVLVALVDALKMAQAEQAIEIYCMGTCPRPAGEELDKKEVNRGLVGWKFGGEAASLAIDSQEFANDFIALQLAEHLNKKCSIIRFPSEKVPASMMQYLGLDDSRPASMAALLRQSNTDADFANSICGDKANSIGMKLCELFSPCDRN